MSLNPAKVYPTITCKWCGQTTELHYVRETTDKLLNNQECFTCNFWLERAERQAHDSSIVLTWSEGFEAFWLGKSREPGERGMFGFGGTTWYLRHLHKHELLVTSNLWCNGKVPQMFVHLFSATHETMTREQAIAEKWIPRDFNSVANRIITRKEQYNESGL